MCVWGVESLFVLQLSRGRVPTPKTTRMLGPDVKEGFWERSVSGILKETTSWIVQLGSFPAEPFFFCLALCKDALCALRFA